MSDLVARLRDADTTRRIGESYADTHDRRQRDRNEAADEIERLSNANETVWADNERLRAALEWINQQRYTGRNTISPDNAFENAISLNEKLIAVMDIARAALAEEKPNE